MPRALKITSRIQKTVNEKLVVAVVDNDMLTRLSLSLSG